MSYEPRKIEPGDSARKAEQEPRVPPFRRIDGGTAAREAERNRESESSIGQNRQGFTLSARIGKPFHFESGVPRAAGEAKPASTPEMPDLQVKRMTSIDHEKLVAGAARDKEIASDSTAESSFSAFPGSLFQALFRRRTRRSPSRNEES